MKKVIILTVALLVAVTILEVLWVSSPSAPPPQGAVTVSFAGYTNNATGARLARFTVAN